MRGNKTSGWKTSFLGTLQDCRQPGMLLTKIWCSMIYTKPIGLMNLKISTKMNKRFGSLSCSIYQVSSQQTNNAKKLLIQHVPMLQTIMETNSYAWSAIQTTSSLLLNGLKLRDSFPTYHQLATSWMMTMEIMEPFSALKTSQSQISMATPTLWKTRFADSSTSTARTAPTPMSCSLVQQLLPSA